MDFLVPVRVGDFVVLRSSVNRVFHTSMEVGVKVWVENYRSEENRHVSSAYLTFVAIDAAGNKMAVPPVVPETEDEKRRYEGAARRREIRRAESARRKEARLAVQPLGVALTRRTTVSLKRYPDRNEFAEIAKN